MTMHVKVKSPQAVAKASWSVRWQVWLSHINGVTWAALFLLITGLALWSWLTLHYRALEQTGRQQLASLKVAAMSASPSVKDHKAVPDLRPLAIFYNVLAKDNEVEQNIGALFTIAQENGLLLQRGDYKYDIDKHSGVILCHIIFPVKGSYNAIWQFALQSLQAMPFASLDNISFRREGIAVATPEAQLSFTLYLKDAHGAMPQPVKDTGA